MRVQNNKISFKGQNIFVGIDVHLRTWSVTVLAQDSGYKKTFTQPADSRALFEHLRKNYPGGVYHAVYESGFSGYSSCYELRDLGGTHRGASAKSVQGVFAACEAGTRHGHYCWMGD